MLEITSALIPVFLVILLGYGLAQFKFAPREDWRNIERIVYFALFPALIISSIGEADLKSLPFLPLAGTLVLTLTLAALSLSLLRRTIGATFGLSGPAYSSVFQGSLRWNGFVALAAVAIVYGGEGITVAAFAITIMVPFVNVLSVISLSRHGAINNTSVGDVFRSISRNPLIIACLIGVFLNVTGIGMPGPIGPTADLLGRAALTLGLLAVGAGLDLQAARANSRLVLLACSIKLILIPISVAILCWTFGITGFTREVLILCGTVPSASSAYVLARQMGGDHDLMAAIITASTLSAIVTMPLMVWLLH